MFSNWFKNCLPKEETSKKKKQQRISVHLKDGKTVIHYCHYRTIYADGRMTLFQYPNDVVADYSAEVWESASVGKRSVSIPHYY